MGEQRVKKVVIAGGGTAGWCVAAALGKSLGALLDITLIESSEIGIVGVGEATVPTILGFHSRLGIDDRQFVRETNAGIKLGIAFHNWARKDDYYFHSFGRLGKSMWVTPFHSLWLQARADGYGGDLGDYCAEYRAAEAHRFAISDKQWLNYAYHFDTALYGPFMRRFSEAHGVKRIDGKIMRVEQDDLTGFITRVVLESGQAVEGDLFIDCTGFRGLLIEQTLKTGYEDWSHWLANDRAWAVQTESVGRLEPYTSAIAHDAGWRWKIPLQSRVGNGYVYSSPHLSDDEARARFVAALDGPLINEPMHIRFRTGLRNKIWNKNCIAFGLASGFIEPLESTNIHLMQIGATRLVQMFPFDGITDAVAELFNAETRAEVEHVRDFVIMHYKLTQRDDTDFWISRRDMEIPETLKLRLDLFRNHGYCAPPIEDVFRVDSWLQVMLGQRFEPQGRHRFGQLFTREELMGALEGLRAQVAHTVANTPDYEQFIRSYGRMPEPAET
ncbi:MAG: tryptophan 7-halogenase [Asticcacaulis sp.]|uniref:tryptophan halogenase family protein n=1 Tax=Asticcacaulis sp. TaxID=1872648 RepID=UPI0039E2892F